MSKKFYLTTLGVAAAIALLSALYLMQSKQPENQLNLDVIPSHQAKTIREAAVTFLFNLVKPAFAEYQAITDNITPSLPAAAIKTNELANLKSFTANEKINFSPAQLKKLEEVGFYLNGEKTVDQSGPAKDDFVDLYERFQGSLNENYREPQNTLFITSDVALHLYHVLLDRSFQKIEETKFHPLLKSLTKVLYEDSLKNYNSTADKNLKASYQRLAVYYLVPLAILDAADKASSSIAPNPADFGGDDAKYEAALEKFQSSQGGLSLFLEAKSYGLTADQEIYKTALAELALIQEAKTLAPSPLFSPLRPDFVNDYSQFKPRSHYTKNNILKSYFMAMMWYGRMGFAIKSQEQTRDAILITGQINNLKAGDKKLSQLWTDLMSTIEFFVGEADDLTPYQYTEEIKKVYGGELSVGQISQDQTITDFQQAAKKDLPLPKILSEAINIGAVDSVSKKELLADTLQFRFMGQRFTLDAYIINKLTQGDETPDPETGQKLPTMPTALEPISLLQPNNQVVKSYLDQWTNDPARIKAQGRQSDKAIAKVYGQLNVEISQYGDAQWNQNIYWGWLNSFRALLNNYGAGYPVFMTNDQWKKKNLETVLGSYTELKHDTLLYAKQSYAEMGGGGPEPKLPPPVKGYVEPDLIFWNRLLALAKTTQQGLTDRNVMPEEFAPRFDSLTSVLDFLRGLAAKELQNKKISDDDFEKLRTVAETYFQGLVAPLPGEELTLKEKRAGIIADIHTDAVNGQILYEATGQPYTIYVAVKDINGTRLTRGVSYRHYEFADKLDGRLSNEDWQAKVYDNNGSLPAEDKWSAELIMN